MAGQREIGAAVVGEEVVEEACEPGFLRRIGFALVGRPERVGLGKVGLERVGGIGAVDVGFAAATVARMDANAFAEKLLGPRR